MSVEHANITNAYLHEPKDVSAASSDQLYHADGAGSGDWEYPEFMLNVRIPDISTADSVWVASPYAATIQKIYTTIEGAITSANAAITAEIGGTLVTDSAITVAFSGSAAGDVDSSTPSAANAVTAGQAIEIITDGGSSTAVTCNVTLVMKRTS